jgi:glycosyltransferase involved in cell wall biosynthesis
MRVVLITEVFIPKIDGVVNRALNLIKQLQRAGDEVLVVCPEADGCDDCSAAVVAVPSFSLVLYPEYRIGQPGKWLAEKVREFDPDVIHFLNPFAFGFRCFDLLRDAGLRTPAVFSFHTLYGEFVKQYRLLKPLSHFLWWLMREYHNQADVNITVSSIMQAELAHRGFERVECWPPAVDCLLFHPDAGSNAMRARLASGRLNKKVLLTVSRLAPEKSVEFLAGVLERLPDTSLAIVGDGPHRAALEKAFAGLDAHFVGYLKGEELAEAYASADAFVYASETETMGNVVLEALASGCAVIAPRAGGIPNLVKHGETGLLYAPRDLDGAVRAVQAVLHDDEVSARLGGAARKWVEDWGWEKSVARVRDIYAEAMNAAARPVSPATWRQACARRLLASLVLGFGALSAKSSTQAAHPQREPLARA